LTKDYEFGLHGEGRYAHRPKYTGLGNDILRGTVRGLTKVADVASDVAGTFGGTAGRFGSGLYKSFAPPGSKHYKPTLGAKLGAAAKELGDAFLPNRGAALKSIGGRLLQSGIPSMAKGGRVGRSGKVRVHKGELVVKKQAVKPLITLLRKSGVALPLSAIRAKAKKS
jgi:hypothetical protein